MCRGWFAGLVAFVALGCQGQRTVSGALSPVPTPSAEAPSSRSAKVHRVCTSPVPAPPKGGRPSEPVTPSDQELCALPLTSRVELTDAKPFAPEYPHCPEGDPFCDSIEAPLRPTDVCFVANQNVKRAAREAAYTPTRPHRGARYGRLEDVRYLDRIFAHFHLTAVERARLQENGFVVLDRLPYPDYASAFHDIFQEQLPVFVGLDPMLHAVYRSTERVLEGIEKKTLVPALSSLLKKLRGGLKSRQSELPEPLATDLDIYLSVAQGLLNEDSKDDAPRSLFGNDEVVEQLLDAATSYRMTDPESGMVLFGRPRVIDFSQLSPRGHYDGSHADGQDLSVYFQAMMWLSRLEFNLVSRSCRSSQPGVSPNPEETPREAQDALALAELVEQTGASVELGLFEKVYGTFAGKREDVSPAALSALARRHGIRSSDPEAQAKLRTAIGDGYRRTARFHFMPQGSAELPVILTLLGPRVVPDVEPLAKLVHDSTVARFDLSAADVGYVLGHDRARVYLAKELATHPTLERQLVEARALLASGVAGDDAYSSWLSAILAVGREPEGVLPTFMQRSAYQDFRLNSGLVAFGQLRHTYALLAAQGYDSYGCEIPDGYVEPHLAVWDALLSHVRRVRSVVPGSSGLLQVLTMLRSIAATEVTGAQLSEPQRRWLGMVAEHAPIGGYYETSEPPKWTGWYFDAFDDREFGAAKTSAFVADYFTLTNRGVAKYLGADGPRLGVFVVDVGGEPRAMVGPVAKGYETESPLTKRLNDQRGLRLVERKARWRDSFAVSAAPEPALGLEGRLLSCEDEKGQVERRFALRASRAIGKVTLRLLDHHADGIGQGITVDVDSSYKTISFVLPKAFAAGRYQGSPEARRAPTYGVEGLHVRVEDLAVAGLGSGAFEISSSPSVFAWKDPSPSPLLPVRWKGICDFWIGSDKGPFPPPSVADGSQACDDEESCE